MDQKYKFLNYIQRLARDSNPDVQVSYTESTYINRLTGNKDIVYLIHKQKRNSPTTHCNIGADDSYKMETGEPADLDLTGSPLKDECDMDIIENCSYLKDEELKQMWSKAEVNHLPIDTNFSTNFLNTILLMNNGDKEIGNSIWILMNDVTSPLLEIKLGTAFNSRGIVKYQHVVPISDVTPVKLHKIHASYIKGPVETRIESTFNVQSNIELIANYSFSNLHTTSFLRLPTNSEFTLNQVISMKNLNSKTSELWENLSNLTLIFDRIKNFDSYYSADNSISNVSDVPDLDAVKRTVMAILSNNFNEEDRGNAGADDDTYSAEVNTQDLIGNIVKLEKRKQKSVLDKLWNLMKYYPYEQCTFAFKILLFHVLKNKTDIAESNVRLSAILSKIAKNDFSLSVIGSEPLHLLLEIGIEKMFKDYEFIFTESNICSEYDFTAFASHNLVEQGAANQTPAVRKTLFALNAKKSMSKAIVDPEHEPIFNEKEIGMKLAKLGHIHILLEHLLLAQDNFNMKNVNIAIFKKMIGDPSLPLSRVLKMEKSSLSLPIADNSKLLTFLKDISPSSFRISMASDRKEIRIRNTFYYSLGEIMPYFIEEDQKLASVPSKEYHAYHYFQIETRKLK